MCIKELRESRGITQKQLAEAMGVKDNAISRYETGEREPGTEMLSKLAGYFGVTVDFLIGFDGKKKENSPAQGEGVYTVLSEEEKRIITEYRKSENIKTAIDAVLKLTDS